MHTPPPAEDIRDIVARALREDIGDGDRTAALIAKDALARAQLVCRDTAVIAGRPWFDEVFRQLSPDVSVHWEVEDGDAVRPNQCLCQLSGPARALLTGERTALNLLQTLSAAATSCRRFADRIKGTHARILDTRKTIPGLRSAQKYAVLCGGCDNHRHGLYDGILIKENHIMAAGSIAVAVETARRMYPDMAIEVEVENLAEVDEALAARADILLLDNFASHLLARAVHKGDHHRRMNLGDVKLEASGDIDLSNVRTVADTGVDYISIGGLTKHVTAVDLSMRFQLED